MSTYSNITESFSSIYMYSLLQIKCKYPHETNHPMHYPCPQWTWVLSIIMALYTWNPIKPGNKNVYFMASIICYTVSHWFFISLYPLLTTHFHLYARGLVATSVVTVEVEYGVFPSFLVNSPSPTLAICNVPSQRCWTSRASNLFHLNNITTFWWQNQTRMLKKWHSPGYTGRLGSQEM
jgi:hypothetical protein